MCFIYIYIYICASVPDQIEMSLFCSRMRRTYLSIVVTNILIYLDVTENDLTSIIYSG